MIKDSIVVILTSMVLTFICCLVSGLIVYLLWNVFAPMFNLPLFTYWQALGFNVLIRALFVKISVTKE